MFSVFQTMLEAEYKRGFEAGIQQQKNEQLEDANRRQEYLFDQGKKLGYDKGSFDGFSKGYHTGYEDGRIKGKYEAVEEINISDLVNDIEGETA